MQKRFGLAAAPAQRAGKPQVAVSMALLDILGEVGKALVYEVPA